MHEREGMFSDLPIFSRSWRRRRRQERRFALGLPEMTRAETGLLRRQIQGAGTMVEFGSGTSTFFALSCGVRRLVSVEIRPRLARPPPRRPAMRRSRSLRPPHAPSCRYRPRERSRVPDQ